MDELNRRVVQILEGTGKTKGQLADMLGISAAQLSHIYSGRNKPGVELLQKLLLQSPTLNPSWLINGIGNQEFTGDKRVQELESVLAETHKTLQSLIAESSELRNRIETLLKKDSA